MPPRPLSVGLLSRVVMLVAVFIVACIAAPVAFAWGCQGHEIVALIAEAHMNPRALAMANDILKNGPLDAGVTRYCTDQVDAFAAASTWADDIRRVRPEASPWHFIDIPRDAKESDIEKYCPQDTGCILSALRDQLAVLGRSSGDAKARADALRFIIHFIGDMHQPLHDVDNNDHGGNCVPVSFFGTQTQLRNEQSESYAPNLHGVWDTDILVRSMGQKTVQQMAEALWAKYGERISASQPQITAFVSSGGPNTKMMGIDPAILKTWSWETHLLANEVTYAKLPVPIPIESPVKMTTCADDNNVGNRLFALHEDLEQPYQDAAVPVIDEQLAKAGARLAAVLNALWPNN